MRIVTWNVNSIGARLPRVLEWLESASPDLLAIQELKCTTDAFPAAEFEALGYHVAAHGNGRWNGVALIAKSDISDVTRDLADQPDFEGDAETRAIAGTVNGVRIWNVYVPNGREPDHPHFDYKLKWLDALKNTVAAELDDATPLAIVGDFNIAPTDDDVWDISKFVGSTHVTSEERQALTALDGIGLSDVMPRALKGNPYTFWDYRNGAFHRGWGMRIDLIYANSAFVDRVDDCWIDREARKGKGASDHAPVVVELSS